MNLPHSPEPEIDARRAKAAIDQQNIFLLDVREPVEWQAGHIAGAVNIPLGSLEARRDEVPRDRRIIAVCRSGARSGYACEELRLNGYQVENLLGGMMAWAAAQLPMEPYDGHVI